MAWPRWTRSASTVATRPGTGTSRRSSPGSTVALMGTRRATKNTRTGGVVMSSTRQKEPTGPDADGPALPDGYHALVRELGDCRWQIMRVAADLADEAGDARLAAGWRWLADGRRWPATLGRDKGDPAGPDHYHWLKARHNDDPEVGRLRLGVYS